MDLSPLLHPSPTYSLDPQSVVIIHFAPRSERSTTILCRSSSFVLSRVFPLSSQIALRTHRLSVRVTTPRCRNGENAVVFLSTHQISCTKVNPKSPSRHSRDGGHCCQPRAKSSCQVVRRFCQPQPAQAGAWQNCHFFCSLYKVRDSPALKSRSLQAFRNNLKKSMPPMANLCVVQSSVPLSLGHCTATPPRVPPPPPQWRNGGGGGVVNRVG